MSKKKQNEKRVKLSKEAKRNLTFVWLSDLIKKRYLNIEDAIDILNSKGVSFSKLDKYIHIDEQIDKVIQNIDKIG